MANTYRLIRLGGSGGVDDKRVKVSTDDTGSGFLEEKVVVGSNKLTVQTLNPGAIEQLELDVDESNIDHDLLTNFEVDEHRPLDDASTSTTSLWSSDKIQTELDGKINAATPMTDNKLVKSVGTSGVDVEATAIDVDDSNNVTGINDLTVDGNLTVNGTTTSVNTTDLEVEDANITVNKNGNQASANTQSAGFTVEMSDATDARIGYDSTTESKFTAGEVGTEHEIVTTNHTQTVINKTINVDNNTLENVEADNFKAGVIVSNLNVAVDNNNLAGAQAVKDYVAQEIQTKDEASEITYDPSSNPQTSSTNVQDALDDIGSELDTAETTLAAHLNAGSGKHDGDQIVYNGTSSLAATDVEAAIDELDAEKYNAADFDADFDTRLATKTTEDIAEGSDLYFTDERAQDAVGTILSNTEIQLSYDDVTPSISASLDTTGRTALDNTTIANDDELIVYDVDAAEHKKITFANLTVDAGNLSDGDIKETSSVLSDNQPTPVASGIAFANATVRSFKAQVSIERGSEFEIVNLEGIQKAADWEMSVERIGDDTGIVFDINASGQVTYTSTNEGTSATARYRADTTSV
jgi:hypothetical protein